MNVSLTPELEQLVNERVASGRYGSASEVVREALRLLDDQDQIRQRRLKDLQEKVAIGLSQLRRGRRRPFDRAAVERIKATGRERLKKA